jgi:hypothetical protein
LIAVRAMVRNPIVRRWRTVMASSTGASGSPVPAATSCSIESTIRSASASRPWMNNQRGLSGTCRRTNMIVRPSTAPMPNAHHT